MRKLFEMDRSTVICTGNSPYILIPRFLRHQCGIEIEDVRKKRFEARFYRDIDTEDVIVRIFRVKEKETEGE